MDKQNSKTIVINIFGNLKKKDWPNLILAPSFEKNKKDNVIIDADAYSLAC